MKITKYKNDLEYSYTLGITLTIELLLKHPKETKCVFYHSSFFDSEGKQRINVLCLSHNIPIIEFDKAFNILSDKDNCYVIGMFEKYKCIMDNKDTVVLVNPSNAGNLGTIIRSCIGFGVKNLAIIKPAVDIFDPKTIRSSMGAIFQINFMLFDSFEDYLKESKASNIYPFMLKAKSSLSDTKFNHPASLIFGNEATGLPDSFLKYNSVIINHTKDIDSLNLPIALSIGLYELTKSDFS